jgi:hypothetical protein
VKAAMAPAKKGGVASEGHLQIALLLLYRAKLRRIG